jgi:hypothetical protein
MSVARVACVLFAAFTMLAQQWAQCIEHWAPLKHEATACTGAAHKTTARIACGEFDKILHSQHNSIVFPMKMSSPPRSLELIVQRKLKPTCY